MTFEIYRTRPLIRRAEWRWRLKADNGRIIADSGEGYRSRADCLHGVTLVRRSAPGADIEFEPL